MLRETAISRILLSECCRRSATDVWGTFLVLPPAQFIPLRIRFGLSSLGLVVRHNVVLLLPRSAVKRISKIIFRLRSELFVITWLHFLDHVCLLPELLDSIGNCLSLSVFMS